MVLPDLQEGSPVVLIIEVVLNILGILHLRLMLAFLVA